MRKDLNILIVDDFIINRKSLGAILKKMGIHSITDVEDAEDAIELASKKDFDVIFMDIQLPGLNGFEASRVILRELGRRGRNVPMIYGYTASEFEHEEEVFKLSGMQGKIQKPITSQVLEENLVAA